MINGQCLPPRSPGGEKYEVDRNLNRDGVSCDCKVSPGENYIQTLLSLVELLYYCALIGQELHNDEIFLM